MYHKVFLGGHVGGDVTMRYTQDGTPVASFSVATNEAWTDKGTNEKQKRTTWWKVTVWRKQAEVMNQWLKKGMAVLIEGTLNADPATGGPRIWTAQDGTPRASYELTATVVRFIGGGKSDGAGEPAATSDDDIGF